MVSIPLALLFPIHPFLNVLLLAASQHDAFFSEFFDPPVPSKISSFTFTSASDTHVRIVIPKAWRAVKVT
jgi:hypothetical protein